MENLEQCPKIRDEQLLEIIRSLLRNQNAVRLELTPVRNNRGQTSFHCRETAFQILQLLGKRPLENALENLLVTYLEGLLDSFLRVKRREALMLIPSAG